MTALYGGVIRSAALGHRIEAASSERIAAQHTSSRKEHASRGAEGPDRLFRVPGAGGGEAALPAEPPRERELVETDRAEEDQPGGGADVPQDASCERHGSVPPRSEQLGHLGDQILGSGASDRLAGHQDDVVSFHPTRRDLTDRCPKDPPGPVPLHRAADLLAGDQRELPGAGSDKQYHPRSVHRLGIPEDALDPRVRTDAVSRRR